MLDGGIPHVRGKGVKSAEAGMFGRIFLKFFWDVYDYLGRLIAANILLCLIITGLFSAIWAGGYPLYMALGKPLLLLALGIGLFLIIALPFPAAAMIHFFSLVSDEHEPEWRDFKEGLKIHYWNLVKITALFVIAFELLLLNILFYIRPHDLSPMLKIAGTVIAGLCFWIFLYLVAMMLYAFPLYVHQRVGIKKVFVRSFILVMDNLGVSLLAIVLLLGFWGLGFVTRGVLVFLLNLALTAALSNSLYVNVMEKYEEKEAAKKEDEALESRPASWKDIKHEEFIHDRHKRYQRTLKDILKPWEY